MKQYIDDVKFISKCLVRVITLACVAFGLLISCRSSKTTRESSDYSEHTASASDSVIVSGSIDSLSSMSGRSESFSETFSDVESGIVEIVRDSAGLPISYRWSRRHDGRSAGSKAAKDSSSSVGRKTSALEASGKRSGFVENSSSRSSKESRRPAAYEKEGKVTCIFGSILALAALIYVCYVILKDHVLPWRRKK